jgi:peptide/nickel transport system ATP-binding protein
MERGESVALVGASGSGKTTLALAIPRLLPPPPACTLEGTVTLDGRRLQHESELRAARGRDIGVVYQDPLAALNPLMRVADQVAEAIAAHERTPPAAAHEQAVRWLARVGLRERDARAHPFELSGGMRQRVVLAMAVARRPSLLILDEPTTSLDSITQANVLALLDELRAELSFAMLLVTHDLALARGRCERAIRMSGGRIIGDGPVEEVVGPAPSRIPRATPTRTAAEEADPVLSVRDLGVSYARRTAFLHEKDERRVLESVSFDLGAGETLAIVGGSGAGKTTLARAILRLLQPRTGRVAYLPVGQLTPLDLLSMEPAALRRIRPDIGVVFQDPAASLDPRRTARESLLEALCVRATSTRARTAEPEAVELLETVGLTASHKDRLPHQLSGGERQRVCLARALATRPRVIILDEAISSLDADVRTQILELLVRLARSRTLSYLFITHDLGSVERFADRVAVLDGGRIVEIGPTAQVFARPQADATRALLRARL